MYTWKYNRWITGTLAAVMCLFLSCNKNSFLDKNPSSDLLVPTTLEDFQALLDNNLVMQETPVLGEVMADNFYLTASGWYGLSEIREHNAYIWAADIYQGQGGVGDWNLPYEQVFYSNLVLEGLAKIGVNSGNQGTWNTLKGSAYFIRAYAFYNLAQIFERVYDSTAANDPGIPLRLSSAIDQSSIRGHVSDTYNQIVSDLSNAVGLLPATEFRANLGRPSKPAAFAMLARVYLSMGAYQKAGLYADSCLSIYDSLIDYNTISRSVLNFLPFAAANSEVLYQSHLSNSSSVFGGKFSYYTIVDSTLFQSYADSDLRKYIFYQINPPPGLNVTGNLKGSYNGSGFPFSGLATDEVYLIRAECNARTGDVSLAISALADLNRLLQNRWVTGSYVPYTGVSGSALVDTILSERRKELPFRGLRWTDLRRLNEHGAMITLTRIIDSATFHLKYSDQRQYVLPPPPDAVGP